MPSLGPTRSGRTAFLNGERGRELNESTFENLGLDDCRGRGGNLGASILHRSGAPDNRRLAIDRIGIKEN